MSGDPVLQAKIEDKLRRRAELLPSDVAQGVERSVAQNPNLTPIQRFGSLLTPTEKDIVYLSPSQIVQRTTSADPTQKLTALQVTKAFIKTATIAQVLTNCLTEIMFADALKRAEELDKIFEKTGKPVGSLHGVPVSLKESFHIVGVETTMCYVSWLGNMPKENSYMTDIFLDQGAVIYCKTSLPQTVMTAETVNNVYGTTTNPFNTKLTPGGSSGGESALIAMRGSPIGIGTDIAGSVRIPASCCGMYALKPSTGRMPPKGTCSTLAGQESVPPTHGPMANSIDGLEIIMKTILNDEPWYKCNKTVPIPWKDTIGPTSGKKWVFGIMMNDGVFRPHPPIQRAINFVAEKLKAVGHEVIEWIPGDYHEATHKLANDAFRSDGCRRFRSILEPGKEELVGPILMGLDAVRGERNTELTVNQVWEAVLIWAKKLSVMRWKDTEKLTSTGKPVDGLICPAAMHMAPPHGEYKDLSQTALFNAFDHTVGTFPVPGSEINAQDISQFNPDEHIKAGGKPFSAADDANWRRYDPKIYVGPPVGLQIAGRRYEEEKVIDMMKVIDAAIHG